ncbi:hypothetical protein GCM10010921_29480 [Microbacterium album]|uniref:Uncharacterized protein n=1 Tax=Microbacterium album TaxID=2053191 RepID=A0A917IGS0_9MICO|nr:hypothetical protein GCM10010921_29480 [Microbacterium album]
MQAASLIMTLRANADATVPFWRNAPTIPRGSVALRAAGAGALVFGAAYGAREFGYWGAVVLVALVLVGAAAIARHNRRVCVQGDRSPQSRAEGVSAIG